MAACRVFEDVVDLRPSQRLVPPVRTCSFDKLRTTFAAPELNTSGDDPRRLGARGERFWQPGGGHDRNIHTRKAAAAVIDYVHDNPVVRGLCAGRESYRWSSARWSSERTGPVEVCPW